MQVLENSFMWADRLKDNGTAEDARLLGEQRILAMKTEPNVSLANLFQATAGKLAARCPGCPYIGLFIVLLWKVKSRDPAVYSQHEPVFVG